MNFLEILGIILIAFIAIFIVSIIATYIKLYVDIKKAERNAQRELEKQGGQKKVSIWKHWENGIAGNGRDEQTYLIRTGNTYNLSSCLGFECDYIELSELDNLMLEKQGERRSLDADKVIAWLTHRHLNDSDIQFHVIPDNSPTSNLHKTKWLSDRFVEQFKQDFEL